jgi:hypothetical protein
MSIVDSTTFLSNINIYNNGGYGIYSRYNSYVDITSSNIHDNSSYGVWGSYCTNIRISNTNIEDNGNIGLFLYRNSKGFYSTTSSSYTIQNNTNYNVNSGDNSSCIWFVKTNAISNTSPSKNSNPSYSGAHGGCYNLETVV